MKFTSTSDYSVETLCYVGEGFLLYNIIMLDNPSTSDCQVSTDLNKANLISFSSTHFRFPCGGGWRLAIVHDGVFRGVDI